MEGWWPAEKDSVNGSDIIEEIGGNGGSGDNFALVIFDTNGGTPQPKALKIAWGGMVGRLRPVNRVNNGFLGWFDEKGDLWDVETRPVKEEDDVDGDGFVTLTVRWEEYAYTVKFDPYPPPIIPPIGEAELKSQFLNQYKAVMDLSHHSYPRQGLNLFAIIPLRIIRF